MYQNKLLNPTQLINLIQYALVVPVIKKLHLLSSISKYQ